MLRRLPIVLFALLLTAPPAPALGPDALAPAAAPVAPPTAVLAGGDGPPVGSALPTPPDPIGLPASPPASAPEAAILSAPHVDALRAASAAQAARLAAGTTPPVVHVVVPYNLVIRASLDLVLLNVTIVGDLYVEGGAQLRLYGSDLHFRAGNVHRVDQLPVPPPIDHPLSFSQLLLRAGTRFETWNLHALVLPGGVGVGATGLADRRSTLGSASLPVDGLPPTATAPLYGEIARPGPLRIFAEAGAGARLVETDVHGLEHGIFSAGVTVERSTFREAVGVIVYALGPSRVHNSTFARSYGGVLFLGAAGPFVAEDNAFDRVRLPLYAYQSGATFVRNAVVAAEYGILCFGACTARANDVGRSIYGVYAYDGTARLVGNSVHDNSANGATLVRSPNAEIAGNSFDRNGAAGAAILAADGAAVVANSATENGWTWAYGARGGIELYDTDAARFEANVLASNAFGVSIPYDSRGTVRVATGNVANGLAIDGADRAYWVGGGPGACENGLALANLAPDTTSGGAFRGAATLQGLVTAYDCGAVTVSASNLSRNGWGVYAWNVASLHVRDSEFFANDLRYDLVVTSGAVLLSGGVFAQEADALLVHDNAARACGVGVHDRVSVGEVFANVVRASRIGVASQVSGTRIHNNSLLGNADGIVVVSNSADVSDNFVDQPAGIGIAALGAAPLMARNVVRGAYVGVYLWFSSSEVVAADVDASTYGFALVGAAPTVRASRVVDAVYGHVAASGGGITTALFSYSACCSPSNLVVEDGLVTGHAYGAVGSASSVTLRGGEWRNAIELSASGGTFRVEDALLAGPGAGAAVQASGSSGFVTGATIEGHSIGVLLTSSSATITETTLRGNDRGVVATGGATSVTISSSAVLSNPGGGVHVTGTLLTITDSDIVGNGVGVRNDDATKPATARRVWWGDPGGPGANGANGVSGAVTVSQPQPAPVPGAGAPSP